MNLWPSWQEAAGSKALRTRKSSSGNRTQDEDEEEDDEDDEDDEEGEDEDGEEEKRQDSEPEQATTPLVTFHLHIVLESGRGLRRASQKEPCWRAGWEKGGGGGGGRRVCGGGGEQRLRAAEALLGTAVAADDANADARGAAGSYAGAEVEVGSPRVRQECVNIHNSGGASDRDGEREWSPLTLPAYSRLPSEEFLLALPLG